MKRLRLHKRLAILMIFLGIAMIVIVGYVDDDPVLPAPLASLAGAVWYFITQNRIRSQRKLHDIPSGAIDS